MLPVHLFLYTDESVQLEREVLFAFTARLTTTKQKCITPCKDLSQTPTQSFSAGISVLCLVLCCEKLCSTGVWPVLLFGSMFIIRPVFTVM